MFSTVFNTEYIVHLKVCTFLQWALSAIYFKISSALLPPRKPRKPTIVDLLTRYTPVQDIVLAELDIVDIISLSRTTKAFQGYVKLVGGTQFNVDERLKHFVTSPSSFRVLQANHNIIIAGNFAYEFMARKPFGETTGKRQLDGLLAQKGANAAALQCFLESDGFRALDEPSSGISTRPMHRSMRGTAINERRTMRQTATNGDICEIKITETHDTPVMGILSCPVTFLLTFITWNRACSILPYETFVNKKTYLLE